MKRFLSTQYTVANDIALLILRLAISIWMLSKGLPKVGMLFSGEATFPAVLGMNATVSLALTVFAQVAGSLLLLFGLFTRFGAGLLAINMFVAVVVAHANDPFAQAEPALHFLLVYVAILLAGAGKFSIDDILSRKQTISK